MTRESALERIEAFCGPDDDDDSTVCIHPCPSCDVAKATPQALAYHRVRQHKYKPSKDDILPGFIVKGQRRVG